jgi:hypothetical protein
MTKILSKEKIKISSLLKKKFIQSWDGISPLYQLRWQGPLQGAKPKYNNTNQRFVLCYKKKKKLVLTDT